MPRVKKRLFTLFVPSMVIMLMGGLVTLLVSIWLYQSEYEAAKAEFEVTAHAQVSQLKDTLHNSLDTMLASRPLFQKNAIVDRAAFAEFAASFMQTHASLKTLSWVPLVRGTDKEAIENAARADGLESFLLVEENEDGTIKPVGQRTYYFPIYYVEPYVESTSGIGVDIGTNSIHRSAMEKAWSNAQLIATAPVHSSATAQGQGEVHVFLPVYDKNTDIGEHRLRSQGLLGFIQAVIDSKKLIANVLKNVSGLNDEKPTSLYIFDVAVEGVVALLYSPNPTSTNGTAAEYLSLTDKYVDTSLNVYGRNWHVIVRPDYSFVPTDGLVPVVVAVGLVFTLMVAAYVYMLRSKAVVLEQAFAAKSNELHDARRNAINARSEIEVANKAKSIFLATMSHELRTPLTGVLGYIDLLYDKVTDPEYRNLMDKLRQAANAQRAIVNDVLDYSRISAGTLEIEKEPFSLQDIIDAGVSTYGTIAKKKGVTVECKMGSGLPRDFVGDPARLQQVVNNLLSNAVKFTHKGSVNIHVEGEIVSGDHCILVLVVHDTGVGISGDHIKTLFDPFVHMENVTTREFGGTGLGLSICKKVTEAMGGTIAVESKVGWGSKFIVSLKLPIAELGVDRYGDNSQRLYFGGGPLRILIVEDYKLVRDMLKTTLAKAGHVVVAAENGAEACDAIYTPVGAQFDLILMDMHMPIMAGAEAVERIKKMDNTIPIIGMSADVMSEHVQHFMQAGISAFVAKPIDWNELGRVIQDTVREGQMSRSYHRSFSEVAGAMQPLLLTDIFSDFANVLDIEQSSGLFDATLAFFTDCAKKLDALTGNPDFEKSKELAHTILGAASTVGAMRVSASAHSLCTLEQEPDDLIERIQALSALVEQSKVEFDKNFKHFKVKSRTLH